MEFLVLLTGVLIWLAFVDKQHVISARNVVIAFLLYLSVDLLVVKINASPGFTPWWYVPVGYEGYTKAAFALLLFGVSFLVMYRSLSLVHKPLFTPKSSPRTVDRDLTISSGSFLLLLALGIGIEAIAVGIFAIRLENMSQLWLRENIIEVYAGKGSLSMLVGFGPSAALFAMVLSRGNKLTRLALSLLFLVTIAPYIITGQRGILLLWLVIALVLWNSFIRKINFRRAVIVVVLLLILSFSYLTARVSYKYNLDFHEAIYQSLRGHVSSEPYLLLMVANGTSITYGQWWDHLWAWVYQLIPRQLWANNKPVYWPISYRIYEVLGGKSRSGLTGSVIVTGLINAGWAGIILYGCILGIAVALLDRMYLLRPTNLVRASGFGLALGWLVLFLRNGEVTASIIQILIYVPTLLMACFLQLGVKRAGKNSPAYQHNYGKYGLTRGTVR